MNKPKTAISPTRDEDYPQWYQQVVKAADLAENAPVRGCMVIKPWGYGIWENIQKSLDRRFKALGHKNAYFPLFIPLSYMEKEAQHVEGFAKECAVVTHHRLKADSENEGKLVPDGELEEPLVVRPTSEMIIGEMFSRWVNSYRDLPLLINQWANIVRWEMRTRLFLRTAEFLWQEGHTAHASEEEAFGHAQKMLEVYRSFCEEVLALPVITGEKTESERFPGAVSTLCIEALMQDGKALQAGTSHYLGQNFAKAQNITFNDENSQLQHAYTTSWGVTTRLIGAIIMTHGDDNGLVLPPRVAPSQVVILPIVHKEESRQAVMDACFDLKDKLEAINYHRSALAVEVDTRDERAGEKKWSWVKKGAPLIVEIGPKDIESGSVFYQRRDSLDKSSLKQSDFIDQVCGLLDEIQATCLERARQFLKEKTQVIDNKEDFFKFFQSSGNQEDDSKAPGFALAHFCLDPEIEEQLQKELKVSIRAMPFSEKGKEGSCIFTGKNSPQKMLFAKAY